ncbi:hypothetical protein CORMATOL_00997 [Corynebacterium matruchotii ATCC 33806]|uniref:Uncharacterized protein n=1 Tax=Corynebacterium matruchotii ATCC 33806 TaxID=566549 RepID=C0E1Z3_9CORY|nr:hypothetical protein CORMATOL_00997 [Corynebacterium matruchotii ATCC 33806]
MEYCDCWNCSQGVKKISITAITSIITGDGGQSSLVVLLK